MQASDDAFSPGDVAATDRRRVVTLNRKTTVLPKRPSEPQRWRLSASDLQLLGCHYNQKALLFHLPPFHTFESAVSRLKASLSEALVYFPPLAGRLITSQEDGAVYVDCHDGGGDFLEASAGAEISLPQLQADDVSPVVGQLFALNGAVNLDGHFLPLLTVQVTAVGGGLCIALTLNHAVADGASLWHFLNSWAELCRGSPSIAVHPVHDRSLLSNSVVRLGISDHHQIERFRPPLLREKVFHFSGEMIARLKGEANGHLEGRAAISSFQALCGHVWRAVTRARRLRPDQETTFNLAVNCRARLEPPLPPSYFGNAIQTIGSTVRAGELLSNSLFFAAGLLHEIVESHRGANVRNAFDRWEKSPVLLKLSEFGSGDRLMGSSPRFAMYENDFGWGKAVAVRSGWANKFDGKISAYPGKGGAGSVDLEISLLPQFMNALETDQQFLYI